MSLSIETLTTQYVSETVTTAVIVSPTLISSDVTITVTSHLSSTVFATFGQTVTIHTPSPSPNLTVAVPTTKYTPTPVTETQTTTVILTELDIYLQSGAGAAYSTWVIPIYPLPSPTSIQDSGQLVYVVNPKDDGWDNWSKGEKAGVIVGVVLGAVLIFAVLWCCCRKSRNGTWWFAHGWRRSVSGTPSMGHTGGPIFTPPTMVNGPIMPYQYGYGYGLRGGAGETRDVDNTGEARASKEPKERKEQPEQRKTSGRNWFTGRRRELDSENQGAEPKADNSRNDQQGSNARDENAREDNRKGGKKRATFYEPPRR